MKMLFWISVLLVGMAIASPIAATTGPNLAADFSRQLKVELDRAAARPQPIITEQMIVSLPAPVQRYMRMTGSIGKPRIAGIHLVFDAEMFQKPGQAGMKGPAEQFDSFDPPKRLFFMRTKMFGLPVNVLHDYEGASASMKVRLASLYNVVDLKGTELSRTETVTLLNDLCFFAPSWLADPRLTWNPIDDHNTSVTFANGPYKISARLVFNDAAELINFISDDRGALQNIGCLRILRWSTPLGTYQEFDGRHAATAGEAIWHYPEGDFTYGRLTLKRFDQIIGK